jgi:hypothetical protein
VSWRIIFNLYLFMFQSVTMILGNINLCNLKHCSKPLHFEVQWPSYFLRKYNLFIIKYCTFKITIISIDT